MQSALSNVVGTVRSNADRVATASSGDCRGQPGPEPPYRKPGQRLAGDGRRDGTGSAMSCARTPPAPPRPTNWRAAPVRLTEQGGEVVTEGGQHHVASTTAHAASPTSLASSTASPPDQHPGFERGRGSGAAGEQGRGFAVVASEVRNLAPAQCGCRQGDQAADHPQRRAGRARHRSGRPCGQHRRQRSTGPSAA